MSDYHVKKLQKRVTNGGMSRREFIKAASAMGFAAAAPMLYSEAAYATPKKGGIYRIGLPAANTGDNFDTGTQLGQLYDQCGAGCGAQLCHRG